jgi:hypothetical protein
MMLVLLQVISPELDQDLSGEELPKGVDGDKVDKPQDKITAVARCILPALRQYNTWLVGSGLYITELPNAAVQKHGRDLWNMYAVVLTQLVNLFNIGDLPTVNYLLEEDESIIGFAPLRSPHLTPECDLFTDLEGVAKLHSTEPGVQRHHPNKEMQARIREILLTAASMETKKDIPIVCHQENGRHIFTVDNTAMSGMSPQSIASPRGDVASPRENVASLRQETPKPSPSWPASSNPTPAKKHGQTSYAIRHDENALASDSIDNDPQASHMVDSLLEPSETAYGKSTANETSYGMHTATANELLISRPSLFGFQPSVFAPQAHELQTTSPNQSLFRHTSPLSLSTKENQLAAAALLDEITGYSPTKSGFGSWGRSSSRPLSSSVKPPVNQVLQESLAQQYPASYSSAFTNSSSIYGNTPPVRNRLSGGANWANTTANGNSTIYPGATDFDRTTMLQSSIWNGSQPGLGEYVRTPPGGQGG